jgi:hypothetical protein
MDVGGQFRIDCIQVVACGGEEDLSSGVLEQSLLQLEVALPVDVIQVFAPGGIDPEALREMTLPIGVDSHH